MQEYIIRKEGKDEQMEQNLISNERITSYQVAAPRNISHRSDDDDGGSYWTCKGWNN